MKLYRIAAILILFSSMACHVSAGTYEISGRIKLNPLPVTQADNAFQPNLAGNENNVQVKEMGQRLFEIERGLQALNGTNSSVDNSKPYKKGVALKHKKYSHPGTEGIEETIFRANGTPMQIKFNPSADEGREYKRFESDIDAARAFLLKYGELLKLKDPTTEMQVKKRFTGDLGQNHVRFSQYFQGLPVWPAELTVHLNSDNRVVMMDGNYIPSPSKPLPRTPRIDREQAQETGLAAVSSAVNLVCESPELIYYADERDNLSLAWKMHFTGTWAESWMVVVDAVTGKVLANYSLIMHNNVMGQGIDLLGQTRALPLWQANESYYVLDTTKPMFNTQSLPDGAAPTPENLKGGILILDLAHAEPDSSNMINFVKTTDPNANLLPDAVSASINLSAVYDYYKNTYNRNSIDGNGMNVIGIVRASNNMENAFWSGQAMFFGDGMKFAAALDVVGHELTHGVTQYTANLAYKNESGAINEAISDIFGEMIEKYVDGHNDWLCGSIFAEPARNMKDPSALSTPIGPYPAHMNQYYHITDDNGGVHINSSIINHCFYMLAEGLNGAIGTEDAAKIFYRALTTHLVANSQFTDARVAAIQSAEELFGADSTQKKKTAEAFDTVGITTAATTSPPPSIPAVQGQDATVFLCPGEYGTTYYMCRMDTTLGDTDSGIYITNTPVRPTRFSVTKDGSIAMFVSADNDICMMRIDIPGSEQCLGYTGAVHAATMNADGSRFAIILLDSSGEPDNIINVLAQEGTFSYELKSPAPDAGSINTILFADVLTFTLDSNYLIYDALNVLQLTGGAKDLDWSIYALELASGDMLPLIPPTSGLNMGNPALSQTSDNFILFTAGTPADNIFGIFAGNLNTGDIKAIGQSYGDGSSSFTGDDRAIVYDVPDSNSFTGISLIRQGVGEDKITISGDPGLWIRGAMAGTIYRRGTYGGTIKSNGYFDLATNIMRLNEVDVPTEQGIVTVQADLLLVDANTLTFGLVNAVPLQSSATGSNPAYQPASGIIDLPVMAVTDQNSNTVRYHLIIQLVPDPSNIFFRIINAEQI